MSCLMAVSIVSDRDQGGDQLSGLLDEGRRLLKADGHKLVWILYLLDTEGTWKVLPSDGQLR